MLKIALFYFILFLFYYCSITVVPIFPHCSPLLCPPLHFHSQSPPCCPCPWVIYTCSLTRPFPLIAPSLLVTASGSVLLISLFCSLGSLGSFYSIRYLSFTAWLTSLSVILSSSIHAVMKRRSSFLSDA